MLPTLLHSTFVDDFFRNFDYVFNDLTIKDNNSFPKYNIIKTSEADVLVELALAGYSKQDIEVSVENNMLTISGTRKDTDGQYLRRGITAKTFLKKWTIPQNLEIDQVKFSDGLLQIYCKVNIPESERKKIIEIQ